MRPTLKIQIAFPRAIVCNGLSVERVVSALKVQVFLLYRHENTYNKNTWSSFFFFFDKNLKEKKKHFSEEYMEILTILYKQFFFFFSIKKSYPRKYFRLFTSILFLDDLLDVRS